MKVRLYIYGFLALLFLAGCDKSLEDGSNFTGDAPASGNQGEGDDIPDGYFVATFSGIAGETRSGITGSDPRVQHVRYLVYKSSGEFVKTKVILRPGTAATWPLEMVRDTLPRGSYKVVFLGNVSKSLFPYPLPGAPVNYDEVLVNYDESYSEARIMLPNAPSKNTTEYYLGKADFSDANPAPSVLLQRIISLQNVHRNLVDAQTALNQLVNNIVTHIGYRNLIQTQAQGILTTQVKAVLGTNVSELILAGLGGVDAVANPIITRLIGPVTDTLYNRFLKQLTAQIGTALAANENQQGLLGVLGALLNPWESFDAHTAIVTMKDFPKSVDYNLNVKEKYTGMNNFRYDFTTSEVMAQKSLDIKGFSGLFNIQKIHVIKDGLIGGLLWNGIIDNSLLLDGVFVDITDSLRFTPAANRRYAANYSFVDLGLKSYTQQTDGSHSLSLTVRLLEVGNIDGVLGSLPILGTILNLVLNPIKQITIAVPLNLPLLGVENLTLSGGWNTPPAY